MPNKIIPIKYRQSGFNLIEVLFTALLSSVALIGLTGLQVSSIKATTLATFNTSAMLAVKEIVGHMKADITAAKAGLFNIDRTGNGELASFSTLTLPSTGSALASNIRYTWLQNFNDTVPNAKAGIHCNPLGFCVIKVQFGDNDDVFSQVIAVQL